MRWFVSLLFGLRLRPKVLTLAGASTIWGVMFFSVAALGAAVIISNVLHLGNTDLVLESVNLTLVKGLPTAVRAGEKADVRFQLTNQGSPIAGATIKSRLAATNTLLSTSSIVTIIFKDPGTSVRQSISMSAVGGNLEGTLKSGWNIPTGYTDYIDLEVTFSAQAPVAKYSLDVWVEKEATLPLTGNPSQNPQTFSVQAAAGNQFLPASVTIKVGDTIRWTNNDTRPHNVVFSGTGIQGTNFLDVGQSYQVTFTSAGSYSYVCTFHDGMTATVIVQP